MEANAVFTLQLAPARDMTMELHVDLPTDKTNRRRVQNRTAQRKFRSKLGGQRENGDLLAPTPPATVDTMMRTDGELAGEPTSNPSAAPPLQQLQQLQQLRYLQAANDGRTRQNQGLIPHPQHPAAAPEAIPGHDRGRRDSFLTADHDAVSSSGQASTPTGLSEFSFSDSVAPDNRLALGWRAPRYYDHRPLDFNPLEAMMAAATREMDTYWDLDAYTPGAVAENRGSPAHHPPQPAEPSEAPTRGPGPRPHLLQRALTEPTMPPAPASAYSHHADGPTRHGGPPPRQESRCPSYAPSSTASPSPPRGLSTPGSSSGGGGGGDDGGWLGALHIAARRGHERIVETLLTTQRADVDEADSDGRTALLHAALAGHAGAARCLLARGARLGPVDRRGRSALHWAAAGGHAAVVRLLLAHSRARSGGAGEHDELRIDAPDAAGWTALHLAVERDCEPAVRLLLDAGADCRARARKTCRGDTDEAPPREPA